MTVERYTKGDAEIYFGESSYAKEGAPINCEVKVDGWVVAICPKDLPNDEHIGNADIIAEAFNVAHETGMTPRELAEAYRSEHARANANAEQLQNLDEAKRLAEIIVLKTENAQLLGEVKALKQQIDMMARIASDRENRFTERRIVCAQLLEALQLEAMFPTINLKQMDDLDALAKQLGWKEDMPAQDFSRQITRAAIKSATDGEK